MIDNTMLDNSLLIDKNPLSILQANKKKLKTAHNDKSLDTKLDTKKGDFKSALKSTQANIKNMDQINKTATDFEAFFVSSMLKPMFKGIGNDTNSMFSGGSAEKVWQGFLVENMGKEIAKQGGFGLSASVKSELIAMQEHKK